jgi:hypothetical protein
MGWMKEMMLAASWAEPLEIKMAAKLDKLMAASLATYLGL